MKHDYDLLSLIRRIASVAWLHISGFENSRNVELTAVCVWPYIAPMDEIEYRGSRLCRLLGNPVIYQLVVLLDSGGPTTPSKLAKLAGRSVQTVSGHLAKLRAADIVRYDSAGKEVRYWLKHRGETRGLLRALEKIVNAASRLG
jgi:DNA-binding transcriptional ArsR family regulator